MNSSEQLTQWQRPHLISLVDFSATEYNMILQTAASFRERLASPTNKVKKFPVLQGQVVANLFFEPSTRTRSSFELAAKRLSADILNFSPGTSSLTKGETILDTAKTYVAMGANLMIIRHKQAGVPQTIAAALDEVDANVRVLNAGDGQHAHPSQALLDLFTLCLLLDSQQPRLELLQGKKIVIVGDILHSRVARSNLWSLTQAGADVHLAGPPTLVPRSFAQIVPVQVHWELEPALVDADFVMALRLQKERMHQQLLPSAREYHHRYGITHERLACCQPWVKVLHPGPTNRGVELSSAVMDDPELSLIPEQVTNGVAMRMALLYFLGTQGKPLQ